MKVVTVLLGAAILGALPQAAMSAEPEFSDYPATHYSSLTRLPDFSGAQREFRTYRTRIREGMKSGPNFSGSYSIIEIGCGTGCRWVLVGNNETGEVMSFPRGGEDNMAMELKYSLSSKLLIVQWTDYKRCVREYFTFTGTAFDLIDGQDRPITEYGVCQDLLNQ